VLLIEWVSYTILFIYSWKIWYLLFIFCSLNGKVSYKQFVCNANNVVIFFHLMCHHTCVHVGTYTCMYEWIVTSSTITESSFNSVDQAMVLNFKQQIQLYCTFGSYQLANQQSFANWLTACIIFVVTNTNCFNYIFIHATLCKLWQGYPCIYKKKLHKMPEGTICYQTDISYLNWTD